MKATDFVEVNPKKMSGTPVFRGTRVPIQNLFDCLEDGETLEQFLEQFPTVTREQVSGVLELSKERLLDSEAAA
ncbi:MAG: DUF433 domain-containing protein [Acidobacteriota bacterium]|jgi:uncharacterized protein (DUF433 family)